MEDGRSSTAAAGHGFVETATGALDAIACLQTWDGWPAGDCCIVIFRDWQVRASATSVLTESQAVRPSANTSLFAHDQGGYVSTERYKVPLGWRPTALRKTSKELETERRPSKEKEQVMTADEIIVGIDDSPSACAALRWAAAYARSTGTALRAIHVVD